MRITPTIEQRGERPNGLSPQMDKIVKFHNLEIPIKELHDKKQNGIIPITWIYTFFTINNSDEIDKVLNKVNDWLRKNTNHRYYTTYTRLTDGDTNTITDIFNMKSVLIIYFENADDAFYTKMVGLDAILNETS